VGDETHWLTREDGHWVLHARFADAAFDCWATTLEPDNLVDFELGNHYTATHPASTFVNRLMLRAYTPSGRVGVMNRDVTESREGAVATHRLQSRAELRELVARVMGVDLPRSIRCGYRPCRNGSRPRGRSARLNVPGTTPRYAGAHITTRSGPSPSASQPLATMPSRTVRSIM
jgi:arylamine N-acetyltransferase